MHPFAQLSLGLRQNRAILGVMIAVTHLVLQAVSQQCTSHHKAHMTRVTAVDS